MRWLLGLALIVATGASTTYRVHSFRQRLKTAPNAWSRDVAEVREGCSVTEIEKTSEAWAKVTTRCDTWTSEKTGYLPRACYTELNLAGTAQAGSGVVADERTASTAARGFSKEVEAKHLSKHASLAPAYAVIDQYEATAESAREAGAAFASAGHLRARTTP